MFVLVSPSLLSPCDLSIFLGIVYVHQLLAVGFVAIRETIQVGRGMGLVDRLDSIGLGGCSLGLVPVAGRRLGWVGLGWVRLSWLGSEMARIWLASSWAYKKGLSSIASVGLDRAG